MAGEPMKKGSFNDYKEYLKVFEGLFSMSDEELRKEIDIATEFYENRDGKTPEVRELEAYFAEMDKKEGITGIERAQRAEKEKRYNEIISNPQYQARKVKIQNIVQTEKFINEYEKYVTFFQVREILEIAEEIIKNSRSKRANELKAVRPFLNEAKAKDREAKARIAKKLSVLDKYFEEYIKRPYLSEEDKAEYEEKKKEQEELLEAKESFPSKEVLEAQANIDKILECSEESKKIINAKNQIKFITDRNNWDKIHLMSKEDLIARLNVEKTNSNVKVEDTKSQESEESKTDGKNKDEQIKKEIPLKEEGREEAPVVSNANEEENKGEIRDLVVIKHSAWEKTKGLLTKLSEKSKEIKKKQDKYLKRYVENYKKLNEGQEPSDFNKWVAKHCRYMSKKVNEVINYRKPINPEDYKGTQAEKLAEIVGINSKKLKKLKDRIIHENEQEGEDYEKTQAKELAEKVAVSKMIGEKPWDRTSSYMEKMLIGQIIDHEEELRTIDEYYQNRNTAKAAGWEVKEYGAEVQDESRKVEEMQSPKDSETRR